MGLENVIAGVLALAVLYALVVVGLILSGRGGLAREVAMLLPHLLLLFRGLMSDARVPRRAKVALAIGAVWLASRIVAALVLRYVLRSTNRVVIQERWRGEPRMLARLLAVTGTGADGS